VNEVWQKKERKGKRLMGSANKARGEERGVRSLKRLQTNFLQNQLITICKKEREREREREREIINGELILVKIGERNKRGWCVTLWALPLKIPSSYYLLI